jgi:hypothetical protein
MTTIIERETSRNSVIPTADCVLARLRCVERDADGSGTLVSIFTMFAVALGPDIAEEALARLRTDTWEAELERLCRKADARAAAARIQRADSRPTPGVTVEAVKQAVRDRGVSALDESPTRERLQRCDTAAIAEIDRWLFERGISR